MNKMIAAILLVLLTVTPAISATEPVVTVPVVLSLTGPVAATGAIEQQALRIYEKIVNTTGGIRGRNVHFDVHDDESNPQVALQLTNSILTTHPSIIMGSVVTATCASMATVLIKNGPVQYCFSPGVTTQPGGYVFASSSSFQSNAVAALSYARNKGVTRVGLIASTDASGQESQRLLLANLATLPFARMKMVDVENFAPGDLSVAAQIAKLKTTNPEFIYVYAVGTALANVLRALHDAGMDIPVFTNGVNMNVDQLKQYSAFVPSTLLFLGFAYQEKRVRDPQIRAAAAEFINGYRREGLEPAPTAIFAWDPAKLVVYALRHIGPDVSATELRDYLANLHGVAGLSGYYDFRGGDQHGIGTPGTSALTVVRWDPQHLTWTTGT